MPASDFQLIFCGPVDFRLRGRMADVTCISIRKKVFLHEQMGLALVFAAEMNKEYGGMPAGEE